MEPIVAQIHSENGEDPQGIHVETAVWRGELVLVQLLRRPRPHALVHSREYQSKKEPEVAHQQPEAYRAEQVVPAI